MAIYELLGQKEEDALHANRLLNVEEKALKRVTRRLLDSNSPLVASRNEPAPLSSSETTDAEGTAAADENELRLAQEEHKLWRLETLLEFAAFENSLVRAQFLVDSNERERQRYAEEKVRIEDTTQEVRDNNALLHGLLQGAQETLELRKSYDALAHQITSNKALKPRGDQRTTIGKLNAEIAELEDESLEYAKTWGERREQFNKIVEGCEQMRRLIRDDKEEAERKEGMDDMDEGHGATPKHSGGATPRPGSAGDAVATPAGQEDGAEENGPSGRLKVPFKHLVGSRHSSRAGTPHAEPDSSFAKTDAEDADMGTQDENLANRETDDLEDGEEIEENGEAEKMDVS